MIPGKGKPGKEHLRHWQIACRAGAGVAVHIPWFSLVPFGKAGLSGFRFCCLLPAHAQISGVRHITCFLTAEEKFGVNVFVFLYPLFRRKNLCYTYNEKLYGNMPSGILPDLP